MARTINQADYTAKRNEILDVTQRLIYTKGYERMTIQDIRNALNMSSGAFYHYFDSKPAVLEGFIERLKEEVELPLRTIVQEPHWTALQKLQRFFTALDGLRTAQQETVIALLRVWYTDENAIVRQKVEDSVIAYRADLLEEIVYQGIREGTFTTLYPKQAGTIILSLLRGMENAHAGLLLSLTPNNEVQIIEGIVTIQHAYMDVVERTLTLPSEVLYRVDNDSVKHWVWALRTTL